VTVRFTKKLEWRVIPNHVHVIVLPENGHLTANIVHLRRRVGHKLRKSDIKQFFQPFDTEMMDAWPVSNDFLKKSPDDASIIENVIY